MIKARKAPKEPEASLIAVKKRPGPTGGGSGNNSSTNNNNNSGSGNSSPKARNLKKSGVISDSSSSSSGSDSSSSSDEDRDELYKNRSSGKSILSKRKGLQEVLGANSHGQKTA